MCIRDRLDVDAGFEYVANEKNKIGFSVSAENISNAVYRDYLNRFRSVSYTHLTLPTSDLV